MIGRFACLLFTISMLSAASSSAQPTEEPSSQSSQHHHPVDQHRIELFPAREASGTAWLPDATPMYGVHRTWRGWEVMLHGNAFAEFLYESGDDHRKSHQFGSINRGMMMARRAVGSGRLGVRLMASVEPWTLSSCGYPNLLATGEMCDGDTIHDRQHPHDLFMELAIDYDRPLGGSLRWQLYAGLVGEPALGPAGFPHRISALSNPIAPIAHHWLDSTHITFGLVTTGLYDRRWKAEMSAFNGREPDENRADLDLAPLDSISGRLSFLPTDRLALQVSAAHLHEAEAEFAPEPRTSVNRVTASATYHRLFSHGGVWATTLAYGVNSGVGVIPGAVRDELTHGAMLESSVTAAERHTWFARFEIVGKPAHDLHAHEFITEVFTVGKVQGGYVRHLEPWRGMVPGIGGTISASLVPPLLAPRYNGRVAPGFGLFLTIRPARHPM